MTNSCLAPSIVSSWIERLFNSISSFFFAFSQLLTSVNDFLFNNSIYLNPTLVLSAWAFEDSMKHFLQTGL